MTINTAGKALWACPTEHQEKNAAVDLSTERKPDLTGEFSKFRKEQAMAGIDRPHSIQTRV